ncbi:MAG: hypothetical protein WDN44_01705 [Sphingomonas sp.]
MDASRAALVLLVTSLLAISTTWLVLALRAREGRRHAHTAGRFRGPWRWRAR